MNITHKHVEDIFEYDGSQINPSWAFQEFGIYGSSIVTWIGPVNITPDNLKDFADVGLEIKSNNMVNFICEFFDQQPTNMRIAYLRQRLLVMIFREILTEKGVKTTREGDDIFVDGRYHSQADRECLSNGVKVIKLGTKGALDPIEFIVKNYKGKTIGLDGKRTSIAFGKKLLKHKIQIRSEDIYSDQNKTNYILKDFLLA